MSDYDANDPKCQAGVEAAAEWLEKTCRVSVAGDLRVEINAGYEALRAAVAREKGEM